MSIWPRIQYKLLNLSLNLLVKSKSIPMKPVQELKLDVSRPIIYVLPYNSKVDLLTLRMQCFKHGLPDPLKPLEMEGALLPRYAFIHGKQRICTHYMPKKESIELLLNYLDLHCNRPNLDIQMVPILVMFGCRPNRQKKEKYQLLRMTNVIQKFFAILWLGRDSFVRFSTSISMRKIADEYGTDKIIVQKLVRVARIHFFRQHLAAVGPHLPASKDLFNKLLASKIIIRALEEEVRSKKISNEKAQQNALSIMKEIAANFSHEMIRLFDRVLGFTWNRFYQVIHVYNAERVRQLAYNGHEIVYVPCHRSHMDYLLLSYVLYNQGLVPPHIAAGVNLNFWPAGPIFRRLGAFFIRRSFKGNKLYSTVFREYLSELFNRGYSIEYFIEGSRSRTGLLLCPKTGILAMTIQAILRGSTRPITLIPIYIGYEHVMEVSSYAKELRGGVAKEQESLSRVLRSLIKLRNLGQSYINFGEPMQVITWLNHNVPEWRESINTIEIIRPSWLTPIVNNIASELMIRINNACIANAMNLCCTALLASRQRSLTRKQLTEQLECYLDIMRNTWYSTKSIVINSTATQMIDHILQMNKFGVEKNNIGDILVIIPREQVILMTYYRNNIAHILILPSLIAAIVIRHSCTRHELINRIEIIYPIIKSELFLHWSKNELAEKLDKLIIELLRQDLLIIKDNEINSNPARLSILQLLAASVRETLQRYAITFWILSINPLIDRVSLEKESRILARHLAVLHDINMLEFFDKTVFNSLILILRDEGYISNTDNIESYKILNVYQMLADLIASDIRLTIENTNLIT